MIVEQVWTGNAYRNFNYLVACPETGDALAILREHFRGPLMAYPDSGYFKMPHWQFVDIEFQLTHVSSKLDVCRAGSARGSRAERLTENIGKARDLVDLGAVFRQRFEQRKVLDLLIRVPMPRRGIRATSEHDHWRASEVGISQCRSQIGGADALRKRNARSAAGSRVTVGHVDG